MLIFFTFLKENELIINYSQSNNLYEVSYKGKRVCTLHMDGECVNFLVDIFGDYSTEYRDISIDENIKEIAWSHVLKCYYHHHSCTDSKSCAKGRRKIIFDKMFENVCCPVMGFSEMTIENLECIKKFFQMRKADILVDLTLNQY